MRFKLFLCCVFMDASPRHIFILGSYCSGQSALTAKLKSRLRILDTVKGQKTKVEFDPDKPQNLNAHSYLEQLNEMALSEAVTAMKEYNDRNAIFEGAFESEAYLHYYLDSHAVSPAFTEIANNLQKGLVFLLSPSEQFLSDNLGDRTKDIIMHSKVTDLIRKSLDDHEIPHFVIDEPDLEIRVQKVLNQIAIKYNDLIVEFS